MKLLGARKSDRKYNYQNTPDYIELQQWLSEINLTGFSTKDVKQSLPDHITHRGHQTIAAAMREAGYENRVVVLDTHKQGRRWFKSEPVSFI